NRAAITALDFDGDVESAPFVDRSGEEFHIALVGEEVVSIQVVTESPGGAINQFDAGETWILQGHWFHRAHGFEGFACQCPSADGKYMPSCSLRFSHDLITNNTTVTMVYPLSNAAAAAMAGAGNSAQSDNGCPNDQNSVLEGLTDLWFSA